jgi:5'-3' exonuclease
VKVELSDRLSGVVIEGAKENQKKEGQQSQLYSARPNIGRIRFEDLTVEDKRKLEVKFKEEDTMIKTFEEERNLEVQDSMYFIGAINYKETFYRSKFDCDALDAQDLRKNVRDYFVEGLLWNMAYYYKGCISWEWFYPYYYAPFPSDFVNIQHLQTTEFTMVLPEFTEG